MDSIDSILEPHKRPPTFTPHTKGKTTVPMGRARSARPIGTVVGAREARAPFVCGVNVGDLSCGTSIASIQSVESKNL